MVSELLLADLVHRINLLTGVILLSIAIYLRGVSPYHTPRLYEYAYALCGFSFITVGLLDPDDLSEVATSLKFVRQISVLVLGIVMFRQLIISTQMDQPRDRFRQVYQRVRGRDDETETVTETERAE